MQQRVHCDSAAELFINLNFVAMVAIKAMDRITSAPKEGYYSVAHSQVNNYLPNILTSLLRGKSR